MSESAAIEREVDQNFEAFERQLSSLVNDHSGKFALMRNRQIVGYFNTAGDALRSGKARFQDRLYSVQEVTDIALDLGYFSLGGAYTDL